MLGDVEGEQPVDGPGVAARGHHDLDAIARVGAEREPRGEERVVDHPGERRDLGDGHPRRVLAEELVEVEVVVRDGAGGDDEKRLGDGDGVGVGAGAAAFSRDSRDGGERPGGHGVPRPGFRGEDSGKRGAPIRQLRADGQRGETRVDGRGRVAQDVDHDDERGWRAARIGVSGVAPMRGVEVGSRSRGGRAAEPLAGFLDGGGVSAGRAEERCGQGPAGHVERQELRDEAEQSRSAAIGAAPVSRAGLGGRQVRRDAEGGRVELDLTA